MQNTEYKEVKIIFGKNIQNKKRQKIYKTKNTKSYKANNYKI